MKIIIGPRRSGKTTELIKMASRFKYTLVVNSNKYDWAARARHMKLDIPIPITYLEFDSERFAKTNPKGYLIDDIDKYLSYVHGNVVGFSIATDVHNETIELTEKYRPDDT